ncbi:nucleoside diphosphate hydrolase [Mycoplasma sp. CAG:877]|nr:nucleoside diphosphate hydrolase [Mycoplasma sp. CAG:877]
MEYLDIYNEKKEKLNKKIKRGDKLLDNEHILVAVIFIENSEGKYLIQKTSKEKGEKYATTGGHVLSGETPKTSIIRETKEELGLDVSNENIIYIGDLLFGIPFGEIYYLKKDLDIAKLKLQQEEVEQVEYLTKTEILKLIETEKMVKSHGLMFKKMLDKTSIK